MGRQMNAAVHPFTSRSNEVHLTKHNMFVPRSAFSGVGGHKKMVHLLKSGRKKKKKKIHGSLNSITTERTPISLF